MEAPPTPLRCVLWICRDSLSLSLDSLQINLTILVLDVNDNAPVFQRRDYGVTVPEDVAVGTEVLRVLATSVDIGLNAEITYRIRSGNELGKFTMDTRLGELMSGESRCASALQILSRVSFRGYFCG